MNTKLTVDIKIKTYCKINITYGCGEDNTSTLDHLKALGEKYQLKVTTNRTYYYGRYKTVKVKGYLTITQTEQFTKETNIPSMIIHYDNGFSLNWCNTY